MTTPKFNRPKRVSAKRVKIVLLVNGKRIIYVKNLPVAKPSSSSEARPTKIIPCRVSNKGSLFLRTISMGWLINDEGKEVLEPNSHLEVELLETMRLPGRKG
jgi:hypothetical protein